MDGVTVTYQNGPDDKAAGSGRSTAAEDSRALAAQVTTAAAGEELLQAAEEAAAAASTSDAPLGRPGRPLNRRSPFVVGMLGAAGVAVTYGLVQLLVASREVLILIGLGLFLAIGLEPAVRLLNRWLPRWLAVTTVILVMLGIVGGFLAAAIPPLISQSAQLVHHLPGYLNQLKDRSSLLGRLNAQFHVRKERCQQFQKPGPIPFLMAGLRLI